MESIENVRLEVSSGLNSRRKSQFGQYMTPLAVARFMASLFPDQSVRTCRLLDPGAGVGSLSHAFLQNECAGLSGLKSMEVEAYEIDEVLRSHLEKTMSDYSPDVKITVHPEDFIEHAVNRIQFCSGRLFTHAILNPPYKKIRSDSKYRSLLRKAGVETVNLYSAFTALSLELLRPGGCLVAILPRSFCNGPYYRPFRDFILERAAIRHMHLFGARNKAFRDDRVLQENLIILLEREGQQGDVTISTSTDDSFNDYSECNYSFDRIVVSDDPENFIHVPTTSERNFIEVSPSINFDLHGLGVMISTGPVVDFRMRNHLRDMPGRDTVPLLYPMHFAERGVKWPREDKKKPNAILCNDATEKWLYPAGFYTVVRRFSSKEEKRRIVASVVAPADFPNVKMLGFENHLNVFHASRSGLPESLARGLAVYLNSSAVDDYFRCFNGHTQVNATDLRAIRYPSLEAVNSLGGWAKTNFDMTQSMIDERVELLAT